jgi:ferredoxin
MNCGGCIAECPQDAIIDGDNNRRKIIPEKCNDCGYCVEEFFCPGFAFEKVED